MEKASKEIDRQGTSLSPIYTLPSGPLNLDRNRRSKSELDTKNWSNLNADDISGVPSLEESLNRWSKLDDSFLEEKKDDERLKTGSKEGSSADPAWAPWETQHPFQALNNPMFEPGFASGIGAGGLGSLSKANREKLGMNIFSGSNSKTEEGNSLFPTIRKSPLEQLVNKTSFASDKPVFDTTARSGVQSDAAASFSKLFQKTSSVAGMPAASSENGLDVEQNSFSRLLRPHAHATETSSTSNPLSSGYSSSRLLGLNDPLSSNRDSTQSDLNPVSPGTGFEGFIGSSSPGSNNGLMNDFSRTGRSASSGFSATPTLPSLSDLGRTQDQRASSSTGDFLFSAPSQGQGGSSVFPSQPDLSSFPKRRF